MPKHKKPIVFLHKKAIVLLGCADSNYNYISRSLKLLKYTNTELQRKLLKY